MTKVKLSLTKIFIMALLFFVVQNTILIIIVGPLILVLKWITEINNFPLHQLYLTLLLVNSNLNINKITIKISYKKESPSELTDEL